MTSVGVGARLTSPDSTPARHRRSEGALWTDALQTPATLQAATRMPGELREIPIDQIEIPAGRIRRELGDLGSLAVSLQLHGQLAPVVVRELDGGYRLVAGERRLQAMRKLHEARAAAGEVDSASPPVVAAIIRAYADDEDPLEVELAENAQRRQLDDEEEADALIQLVRDRGYEMQAAAGIAGRSVAYVSKRVRVFEDPVLRAVVQRGELGASQAEEFLVVPQPQREALVQRALQERWTQKEIREAAQQLPELSKPDHRGSPGPAPLDWTDQEEDGQGVRWKDRTDSADEPAEGAETFRPETFSNQTETPLPNALTAGALHVLIERPADLTRRVRELNQVLRDLRPFQLTPQDDQALAQLWLTMRMLAQAPREPTAVKIPSMEEAEALARRGRR